MASIDPLVLRDAILGHLPNQCVTAVDTDLRYMLAAGRLLDVFGLTQERILGRTVEDVLGRGAADAVLHSYSMALKGHEVTIEDRAYRDHHLEQAFFPLYIYGDGSPVVGACSIIRDVSHRRRNELHLERLATTDALTALDNPRAFDAALRRGLRAPCSLLVLDLNGFKAVNDSEGHAAGDEVLRRVGAILTASTRPNDIRARIGGDEFAVILPNTGSTEAFSVAIRIRLAISGRLGRVSAAVGIATCPDDGDDALALKAIADARMYKDKRSAR